MGFRRTSPFDRLRSCLWPLRPRLELFFSARRSRYRSFRSLLSCLASCFRVPSPLFFRFSVFGSRSRPSFPRFDLASSPLNCPCDSCFTWYTSSESFELKSIGPYHRYYYNTLPLLGFPVASAALPLCGLPCPSRPLAGSTLFILAPHLLPPNSFNFKRWSFGLVSVSRLLAMNSPLRALAPEQLLRTLKIINVCSHTTAKAFPHKQNITPNQKPDPPGGYPHSTGS
jgi:hypothetical protein